MPSFLTCKQVQSVYYLRENFCLSSFSNEKGGPAPPVVLLSYLTYGTVVIPSYLSYVAVKRKK